MKANKFSDVLKAVRKAGFNNFYDCTVKVYGTVPVYEYKKNAFNKITLHKTQSICVDGMVVTSENTWSKSLQVTSDPNKVFAPRYSLRHESFPIEFEIMPL